MLNKLIYTQILRQEDEQNIQFFRLDLYKKLLIITKETESDFIQAEIKLDMFECYVRWKYDELVLKQIIIVDAGKKLKISLTSVPDILLDLQKQLDGRCYYRGFYNHFIKVKTIVKHKNVEIFLCQNIYDHKLWIAKKVQFQNDILDDSSFNHFVKREAEAYLELGYEKSKYLLHSNYIFTHDNGIIYVMEYCQGGTLYEYLRDNSLIISDDETRKIMKKLLKGLNHLHLIGLIHRDIKLDNIMFLQKDNINSIKILDFGYAGFIIDSKLSEQRCGTAGYIAPEILNLGPYNELCDIYSLGSVFHSLLTGRKLFSSPKSTTASDIYLLNKKNVFSLTQIRNSPAKDLLELMLKNYQERPSAQKCLQHEYFQASSHSIFHDVTQIRPLIFPKIKNPFKH